MKTPEGYLSIPQAADFVGMYEQLFRWYSNNNRIPNPTIISGRIHYHIDDLRGWKPIRKKLGRKKKEVKVTPKMIEAGMSIKGSVKDIYVAMWEAR